MTKNGDGRAEHCWAKHCGATAQHRVAKLSKGTARSSLEMRCEGMAWKSSGKRWQGEVVNALQS